MRSTAGQRLLFAQTVELPATDADLLRTLLPELNGLGYDVQEFGHNTFIIHGLPAHATEDGNEQRHLEQLLEAYKNTGATQKTDRRTALARTLARHHAHLPKQPPSSRRIAQLVGPFVCLRHTECDSEWKGYFFRVFFGGVGGGIGNYELKMLHFTLRAVENPS